MEANMPGDPKECRQHAERCGELARLASTPEARDQFLSLQITWIRLAMELTQAKALIEATKALEEEQPIKAADRSKGADRNRRPKERVSFRGQERLQSR